MKNQLVLYPAEEKRDPKGEVNKIELDTPLKDRWAENRMLTEDGLYFAGFKGYDIYPLQIFADIYFGLCSEVPDISGKESCDFRPDGIFPLFSEKNRLFPYDGKIYEREWWVENGQATIVGIDGSERETIKATPKMYSTLAIKMKIINEIGVVYPNDFIRKMFEPLFEPVIKMYEDFASF